MDRRFRLQYPGAFCLERETTGDSDLCVTMAAPSACSAGQTNEIGARGCGAGRGLSPALTGRTPRHLPTLHARGARRMTGTIHTRFGVQLASKRTDERRL